VRVKKTALRIFVSVVISLAVLWALMKFTDTDLGTMKETLGSLSPWTFLAAFCLHMATYCLRALRFWVLVPPALRPSYPRIWVLSGAHNLASYVLPAKTGEASWVVYLRTFTGVPSSPGIASLVVSRLLDAAVLAASLSLACMYLASYGGHGNLEEIATYVAPLALAGLVLGAMSVRGDLLVHLLSRSLRLMRLHKWRTGARLVLKVSEIATAMRVASRGHRLSLAALLTVPVWMCIFGFYMLLAQGMGIFAAFETNLTFPEAIFGSSLAVLANLLPINGAAGVGTQEMGWTTGFVILGVQETRAFAVGLGVHFVQLFNVVAVGMFCHFMMKNMARAEKLDFQGFLRSYDDEPLDDGPDATEGSGLSAADSIDDATHASSKSTHTAATVPQSSPSSESVGRPME